MKAEQQKGRLARARLFRAELGEAVGEKSTFASRESSAGSWAGSPTVPRASAGSSAPPSLELLSADAERSDRAASSFCGRGLMKNLGAGGLNLENNITLVTDPQWEGRKPARAASRQDAAPGWVLVV